MKLHRSWISCKKLISIDIKNIVNMLRKNSHFITAEYSYKLGVQNWHKVIAKDFNDKSAGLRRLWKAAVFCETCPWR